MAAAMAFDTNDASGKVTTFHDEIFMMMHGFGDNPRPNAETVVLVDKIVHRQLTTILNEAEATVEQMGGIGKNITNYPIIFLMRKNILKLRRLWEYQIKLDTMDKRLLTNITEGIYFNDDEDKPVVLLKRNHIDIIKQLDGKKEVEKLDLNEIEYLRKVRAEKLTEHMTFEQYQHYHKCRCVSFHNRNCKKMRSYVKLEKWLNPTKEYNITESALEVLGFIAYETVGEIVDAVYLIRQDAKRKPGDPFSRLEGGYFCNPVSLSNASCIKSGYEGVTPIKISEVQEAMRRYFTTKTVLGGLFFRNLESLPPRFIAF